MIKHSWIAVCSGAITRWRRRTRWTTAPLLVAAAFALGLAGCAPRATPEAAATATTSYPGATNTPGTPRVAGSSRAPGSTQTRSGVGFRTQVQLDEHYAKHGREFGGVSRAGYLRIAQELRDAPVGGSLLEMVRDDGVATRFDRGSGTFIAFNRNGTIRTCFRPRDGERYFRRQALRRERGR